MSVRVMSSVWQLDLPDSQKIVLLALADCANDEGAAWPSMATLAKKCSKGARTIQGVIKELVLAGHLSRDEVTGKGCRYTVHPRNDCAPAEDAPRKRRAPPPQSLRDTPAAAADKPSENHQEPSEDESADALAPGHVWEFYSEMARELGRPIPKTLDPDRRQVLRHRIAQNSVDDFLTVFANIRASPFLRGDKNGGRTPLTFDWLFQKTNFRKVLEGNFND